MHNDDCHQVTAQLQLINIIIIIMQCQMYEER